MEVTKLAGVGLLIAFIGYALMYWGVEAIQGKSQGTFISYVFPFAK